MSDERRVSAQQVMTDTVIAAAQVVSVMGMAVALAALLFNGDLLDGRAQATAGFAVGGGLVLAWLAHRSRIAPLAAVPQDAPAVVLVAVIAALVAREPGLDPEAVLAVLALSTFVIGVLMFTLGSLRLGEVVRYLPTVVVHGFIAGTGWLLLRGGFEVALDRRLALEDLDVVVEAGQLARWTPALGLAALVYWFGVSRRVPTWAASGVIVVATALFYVVVAAGSSVDAVEDDGWLIGPFDADARPLVVDPGDLADLPWGAVGSNVVNLVSLLVVSVVALLLNLSALERIRRDRVDTSHELREAGIANVAASVFGSVPVFHALGDTVLAERMGVRNRGVLVVAGLATAALGVVGAGVVGYVPQFVAAGILMAVGISLLVDWVQFLSGPLGWVERLLSASVVVSVMVVGIIEGVLIGLVLAAAVFVVRYSRVDAIRRLTDGSTSRGRIDRSPAEAEVLARRDAELRVMELQGYIFFALATKLVDTVRNSVGEPSRVRTVLIDLRFVTGVEPGTAAAMESLWDEMAERNVEVILSGPDPELIEAFSGRAGEDSFPTLDHALGFVENRLLLAAGDAGRDGSGRGAASPSSLPLDDFDHQALPSGTLLMRSGDPGDTLMYVSKGSFSVIATSPTGERHVVRRAGGPAWLGETGFLRGSPRSADVVADTPVECAVLSREAFDELRTRSPEVATAILEDIAVTAASRTASLTSALAGLLD